MDAWMAFVSILAVVAIVLVAGGIIGFIGHMIIGAFDSDRRNVSNSSRDSGDVMDYSEYKQRNTEKVTNYNSEYDFDAINTAKARQEMEAANKNIADDDNIFDLSDEDDYDSLENRLAEKQDEVTIIPPVQKAEPMNTIDEDDDLASLLDEISNDVIEKEKATESKVEEMMSDHLKSYSIDDVLKELDEDEDGEGEEDNGEDDEGEEIKIDLEKEKLVISKESSDELDSANQTIKDLKTQLEALNRQLETARTPEKTIFIDMTEEECMARLALLEERLKVARSEYKINQKEYKPLEKVKRTLERDKAKLRRRDIIVAKKKVSLYGVNNYVDIDKDKAEKLANELELLDGLRLSVNHCEEVMNINRDRYPILEHTNKILENQISHLRSDIEAIELTIARLRSKKDK